MAITKVRSYNTDPYFDDYREANNFHRVLFRPGYAVQARELTQLQTALQAQIDRFGQYNFKDGSRVVGGKVTVNTEYDFIKLTNASFTHSSTTYNTTYQSDNLANFVGTTITGTSNTTNQVTAKVIEAVVASGSDPHTLYIKYDSAGDTNSNVTKFVAGEVVTSSGGTTYYGKVGASGVTPIGQGSRVSIEEGAYFIAGCFAYVSAANLILDKYTNTPSYTIALKVDELLIAADDAVHDLDIEGNATGAMNDNATGTPNFAAPGANRYKIFTTLVKDNLVPTLSGGSADTYTHKITLLTVENGITKVDETDKTYNTELTARLARRTHEESGDYAIRPFTLDIREHLLDGNNGGYLASGAGGSADKVAIGIEPSVAYVKGYRIENLATNYIAVDKPRGTSDYIKDNAVTQINSVGNYIKCAASAIDGTPDIITFKTVQLKNSGASVIGTARIRDIEYISAAEVRLYLFDISMGANNFGDVTNLVQGPVGNSGTNFIVSALTTTRYDSGQDGLVFKLPRNGTKTLKDGSDIETIYTVRKKFTGTLSGSQTIAISITDGILANNSDMVITLVANDPVTTTSAAMPAAGGTSFTLNCTGMTGSASGAEVQVIYSVYRAGNTNSKLKSKTKEEREDATITADGSTSYGLGRADAIAITALTDVNDLDIKDKFILDTGQTDNFYNESRILLKGGEVVPNGAMTITFDYWSHGSGDYFTVDSYPTADYVDIPSFSGKQGAVELRDCVDFRPTKGSGSPTTGNEFGTGTAPDVTGCPLPGSIMTNDITYYLPRIDKLFIDRNGSFAVVEGVAAKNPAAPEDPEDAMVIYKLNLNPYVYKLSDIVPTMVDNKRYTMRDIGKIDKRVKNLEYYTSLSLLEKEAADTQIFDSAGNTGDQRFKNGFIVDGFYGHNRGNVTHTDYNIAIDRTNGILRPKVAESNVNLIRKASEANGTTVGSTTYAKKAGAGGIVTMPYTESAYITQPYSSYNEWVNPYNVFSWSGQVKLSPESDEWKETEIRPDVIINDTGLYDQLVQQAEASGILGTVWNEWTTNWSGSDDSVETFVSDEGIEILTTTVTTTTTTSSQTQTGFQTTAVPDTQLKDLGSRVVEINFVPFIRSRKIYFKAELMKPSTKVYAFFNGQDVTGYCDDGVGFSEWSDASAEPLFYDGATVSDTGDGVLKTDATGQCTGSFIIPRNDALKIKTGTRLFRLTDSSSNNTNTETTSAEGLYHAQGLLEVSENVIIATKVPTFVTSEISQNKIVESTSVNSQLSVTTTWIDPLAQTFLCDTAGGVLATSVKLYFYSKDSNLPVSISIRSVENGIPTQKVLPGSAVNVYPADVTLASDLTANDGLGNADRATTVTFDYPVYLSPDQEYAIVLMSQSDDYKVYVAEMGGSDLTSSSYKITKQPYNGVFFTSQNASTWTPEQTKDLKFILNTADFTDLKDPQDHSATLTLVNDVVPTVDLRDHPFQFLSHPSGSTLRVRVLHKNHGMYDQTAPGRVTIAGAVATNGVAAAALNATHILSNNKVDHDSYEIVITEQATSVATDGTVFGGGTAVTATTNNMYNLLYPIIQNVQVPGTSIKWFLTGYSGKSMDGAEADYAAQTEVQILANGNNYFTSPMTIASAINETNSMSGAKSFSLRCVLSHNGNTNVSPIIDMNRSSAVLIENILNDATTNSSAYTTRGTYVAETAARNTSNFAKYVTKKVELNAEASNLDVYINANKPDGGNIDLYYKVQEASDNEVFDDKVWILAAPENTILTDNSNTYREVHYAIDPAGATFDSFAFKMVLRSTNSSYPPTLKDFRAIAST